MVREQGSPGGHRYRYLSASDGSGCRSRSGALAGALWCPLPLAGVWRRSCASAGCGQRKKSSGLFFFHFFFFFFLSSYPGKWNSHGLEFRRSGKSAGRDDDDERRRRREPHRSHLLPPVLGCLSDCLPACLPACPSLNRFTAQPLNPLFRPPQMEPLRMARAVMWFHQIHHVIRRSPFFRFCSSVG